MADPDDELVATAIRQSRDYAFLLIDETGTIRWTNEAGVDLLRAPATVIVGQSMDCLFTPEDVARGMAAHELDVASRRGMSEDDRWTMRMDGSRFWASGVLFPVALASGEQWYGKVLRNRTELREQIDAWQNRASAVAAELRRLELGYAAVVHELRSPVGALTYAIEVLKRTGDASVQAVLPTVERQLAVLVRLADDLLDVARVHAGKLELKRTRFDLWPVLRTAAAQVQPQVDERRHRLELMGPEAALWIDGDPARLAQVFDNLLVNAVKYTPDGGRIWVIATAEGGDAVVRVVDNGVGLSPELAPQVFELFSQAQGGTATGGLGIGLALVREIVALHDGTVTADSQGLGTGATFVVRLPLVRPAAE